MLVPIWQNRSASVGHSGSKASVVPAARAACALGRRMRSACRNAGDGLSDRLHRAAGTQRPFTQIGRFELAGRFPHHNGMKVPFPIRAIGTC